MRKMEFGRFYKPCYNEKVSKIAAHLIQNKIISISQVCERWGEGIDDVRCYDTYMIHTVCGAKILRQSEEREVFNYENYLCKGDFNVPQYYGSYRWQDEIWILVECIDGKDLRDMEDEMAIGAADSLAQIQNHFWHENEQMFPVKKNEERFEIYWKRILKRAMFVADSPTLRMAYQKFLDRQLVCPRTLSNGDYLQFNAVQKDKRVMIIDWGFGGIMPYSLDIARFIAHATETRATFPFYMNVEQKELFVKRVYEKLEQKPSYEQYIQDIKLAVLNEYIEFVEAEEDENGWYRNHALELAEDILI